MIDRNARNKLARAMRALASGLITNDEFEDNRFPHYSQDIAIFEVFSKGAWYLYSDLQEYGLAGNHRLKKESRHAIARWILFLKTDYPYEWPVPTHKQALLHLLANLFTLGRANRIFIRRYRAHGDADVWPFLRRADYESALRDPVYLNHAL